MIYISIIIFIYSMFVPMKHALHMFQQNRYEAYRYWKWATQQGIRQPLIYLGLASILCIIGLYAPLFITSCICGLIGTVLLWKEMHTKYIKPLHITMRVLRQWIVLGGLEILLLVLMIKYSLYFLCGLLIFIAPWILIFVMHILTMPIEALVKKWYLNDAKRKLSQMNGLIKIGITGSYGKTSTKNVIQSMMLEKYHSLMTPASFNTPMGITRTIREYLKPIHEVFVCEMGADHVGEITYLMNFVKPKIGVVTSIGPQHLNTFKSQENIIKEKMQMIECLPQDGFGVLNYDNTFIAQYKIQNSVKVYTYGIQNQDVDFYAKDIQYTPSGSTFTVVNHHEEYTFQTKLLGELNILNILSSIVVARGLFIEWAKIQNAVRNMAPVEHRLQPKLIQGYHFIDDAFNSNPVGSAKALEVMALMPNQRYIVTPGMIDLGPKQEELNYAFGQKMKGCVDVVILVGKNQTKSIYQGLVDSQFDMDHVIIVDHVHQAFQYVYTHATKQDTILLENDLPDAFNH